MTAEFQDPSGSATFESAREEFMYPDEFTALSRHIKRVNPSEGAPSTGTYSYHPESVVVEFDPLEPSTWKKTEKTVEKYDIYLNPNLSKEDSSVVFIQLLSQIRKDMKNRKNHPTRVGGQLTEEERKKELEVEERLAKEFYRRHPKLVDGVLRNVYPLIAVE